MYLPYDLKNQLDTTTLTPTFASLVVSKRTLLEQTITQSYPTKITPNQVFWALFLVIILLTFAEWKKKKYFKWLDIILFFSVGIVSFLVFFLWFLSDHSATKGNWNLLWANPLFLYVLFRLRKTQRIVLQIIAVCLLFFLFGFWFLPQHFNTAFIPINLISIVRVLMLIYWKKR